MADYRLPDISDRYLKGKIGEVLGFLNTFLASDTVLRDDYRQLAALSFLVLGGKGGVINMHAPGASHHARWMSSMIYTMKITLFRHQLGLVFQEKVLDMIQELAIYLALFYVRYWLTCTSPADAPAIDLKLMLDLEVASKKLPTVLMKNLAVASYKKMINHLWYLSERLVPLALSSNKVSDLEKANIVKEMKKFDPLEKKNQAQKMPSPKKVCV